MPEGYLRAPVFRAPMRARDRPSPPGEGTAYGLAHGVVAIGDDDADRAARFAAAPEGAFVWTRDADGVHWLGRIAGPCARDEAGAAVGLPLARPTEWQDVPVPEARVPPAVLATFARGGRNFQRTHDAGAEAASASLWAGGP